MHLSWIRGVTVRSLRNFCFGVSYFTDGAFGNSQTRLVNTRRVVFTGAHELIWYSPKSHNHNVSLLT